MIGLVEGIAAYRLRQRQLEFSEAEALHIIRSRPEPDGRVARNPATHRSATKQAIITLTNERWRHAAYQMHNGL